MKTNDKLQRDYQISLGARVGLTIFFNYWDSNILCSILCKLISNVCQGKAMVSSCPSLHIIHEEAEIFNDTNATESLIEQLLITSVPLTKHLRDHQRFFLPVTCTAKTDWRKVVCDIKVMHFLVHALSDSLVHQRGKVTETESLLKCST